MHAVGLGQSVRWAGGEAGLQACVGLGGGRAHPSCQSTGNDGGVSSS